MNVHPTVSNKPSICFVALNAYNVLSGREDIPHIGGAEIQQVRIASWLAQKGYRVSFVTLDHGQGDAIDVNGIRVFKAYGKMDGVRGLRFVHPRWSGLWRALARADADVYYKRCAEVETGQVALWCRLHRRRFIFAAASDADCDARLLAVKHAWHERVSYLAGLGRADAVIAQTKTQQDLFRRNMGLTAQVIRNCGWSPAERTLPPPPTMPDGEAVRVLWVGQVGNASKRFEWLLDVAAELRDVNFDVIGALRDGSPRVSVLLDRAARLPNVTMHGIVPYAQMMDYYRRCRVLCCTSSHEGFPNTFLEAWALGIPVVSTFDPDGIIATHGLGFVGGDQRELAASLQRISRSPEVWRECSIRARQYCLENHASDVCLPRLERLLLDVAAL